MSTFADKIQNLFVMKRTLFIIFSLFSLTCISGQTTLSYATDDAPVIDALLFNASGQLLGLTATDGIVPQGITEGTTLYAKHFLCNDVALQTQTQQPTTVTMPALQWHFTVKNAAAGKTHIKLATFFRLYEFVDGELSYIKEGTADYVIPLKGNGKAKKHITQLQSYASEKVDDAYDDLCRLPQLYTGQLVMNTNNAEAKLHNGYIRTLQHNGTLRYVTTNSEFKPVRANFFGARTAANSATIAAYYDNDTQLIKALHQTTELTTTIKKQSRNYILVSDVYVTDAEYLTAKEAKVQLKQSNGHTTLHTLTAADKDNAALQAARKQLKAQTPTDKMRKALQ